MEDGCERTELSRCHEWGTDVWPEHERSYLISDDVLRYECAARRGGAYDELHDRRTARPHLTRERVSPP